MKFLKLSVPLLLFAIVALVTVPLWAQSLGNPTPEEMTAWLSNPWVLYGLMILGSIVSGLKQVKLAKMDGGTTTNGSYFTSHWMDVLIVLGSNTLAFIALIYGGQLNFVSAVSVGFALNELVDLNPASSRSSSLVKKE